MPLIFFLIILVIAMVFWLAWLDAEMECIHYKMNSAKKPGVPFPKKSWLRKKLSFLID